MEQTSLEKLVAANFVETNLRMDEILKQLTEINDALEKINSHFTASEQKPPEIVV